MPSFTRVFGTFLPLFDSWRVWVCVFFVMMTTSIIEYFMFTCQKILFYKGTNIDNFNLVHSRTYSSHFSQNFDEITPDGLTKQNSFSPDL